MAFFCTFSAGVIPVVPLSMEALSKRRTGYKVIKPTFPHPSSAAAPSVAGGTIPPMASPAVSHSGSRGIVQPVATPAIGSSAFSPLGQQPYMSSAPPPLPTLYNPLTGPPPPHHVQAQWTVSVLFTFYL